jgi:DNA helicase-2/ATP-dependent DNA helicase PcrA
LKLNPEQEIAVKHKEGPILIFAGAGSGKTRVISNRIVHLVKKREVEPSSIIALSFTNKSSKELRERVLSMVPRKELRGIVLSTFHSLGLQILKKDIEKLGYHKHFLLQTPSDIESILVDILKQKKIEFKEIPIPVIQSHISKLKNMGEKYKDYLESNPSESGMIALSIYEDYNQVLKNINSIDFDDLILLPIRLIKEFEEVKEYYHKKYNYFMIDEFQDTNLTQYEFIKLLINKNKNLCVVGDDDQSIYGFRGSDVSLILNFEKDFKESKVVRLLQNYRSTTAILDLANSLILHNKFRREKKLWSQNVSYEKPRYVEREDERDEASFIADQIEHEMQKNHIQGSEISVLFRTNYQSRPIEEELRSRGIPYKLIGAYNFFDRKEIKDIIAYIRCIANSKDELSLLRILNYPKRGIGQTSISKIQQKSYDEEISTYEVLEKICADPDYIPEMKKNVSSQIYNFLELIQKYKQEFFSSNRLTETLKKLIKEINFEKEFSLEENDEKVIKARMLNLSEFINMLSYFESDWENENKPTLYDFLYRLSLLTNDEDTKEERDNRVQLMTMHLSKGLEFEVVFLIGIEEGIIPSSRTLSEMGDVDEERRLMYVGITRAKKRLVMTRARNRRKYGETFPTEESRFITEMNSEYFQQEKKDSEELTTNFLDELEKLK